MQQVKEMKQPVTRASSRAKLPDTKQRASSQRAPASLQPTGDPANVRYWHLADMPSCTAPCPLFGSKADMAFFEKLPIIGSLFEVERT